MVHLQIEKLPEINISPITYLARGYVLKRGIITSSISATTRKIDAEVRAIVEPVPVSNSAET